MVSFTEQKVLHNLLMWMLNSESCYRWLIIIWCGQYRLAGTCSYLDRKLMCGVNHFIMHVSPKLVCIHVLLILLVNIVKENYCMPCLMVH